MAPFACGINSIFLYVLGPSCTGPYLLLGLTTLLPRILPACSVCSCTGACFCLLGFFTCFFPLFNLKIFSLSPLLTCLIRFYHPPGFILLNLSFPLFFLGLDSLAIITLYFSNTLRIISNSMAVTLTLFSLRIPLHSSELLRTPKNFCLCGLYLSIFVELEVKSE